MQKNQKMLLSVQTAENHVFPTACALLVVTTKDKRLKHKLKPIRIGIDLMGNENSPQELLKQIQSLSVPQGVELIFIGPESLKENQYIPWHDAPEVITQSESPVQAIKTKKKSSLLEGLRLLHEKKIDTFITAGNTGALVLGSKIIVSTLPAIKRPALAALFPCKGKMVLILDLGANIQHDAQSLIKHAFIGSIYAKITLKNEFPKVGLLNIGEESAKGTSELKKTFSLLKNNPSRFFEFAGNIESHAAFDGKVDVLITDGFTGNIFLKTAESTAAFITEKVLSFLEPHSRQLQDNIKNFLNFEEFSSATVLGLQGHVRKLHSHSNPKTFAQGVKKVIEKSLEHEYDQFCQKYITYLQEIPKIR